MVLLAAVAVVLAPFKVDFAAPTHTPTVNTRWNYSIRALDRSARPIKARVTVQIVDPFGGVHPVQFGNTQRNIVNFRFTGTFRDFVKWPPTSRGFRLTFMATVTSGGKAVRVRYWVKPR